MYMLTALSACLLCSSGVDAQSMLPVQDTSSAMHQLRSARKAPPALPMPAAAITEEAEEALPMEELMMPTQLSALDSEAAGAGLPEETCVKDVYAPSPVAENHPAESTARKDGESGAEAVHLAVRAGDSPLPDIKVGIFYLQLSAVCVWLTCDAVLSCMSSMM